MPAGGNLITRVCSSMQSMSDAERRIAEYLIHHQSATVNLSQAELASECGVSPASISRFCKRLGERDYHAFIVSLAQSISQMHGTVRAEHADLPMSLDTVGESLASLLSDQIARLTSTIEAIDEDDFRAAVELICGARMVEVAAAGRSISVAIDAAYKLERIGIMCVTSEYYEKILSCAMCLTEDDVVLMISRSGWSGVLQQVLHAARDRGASVILITAADASCPLGQLSDYVFTTAAVDTALDGSLGNSRLGEMALIEALYAFAAAHKKDSLDYLEAHGRYVLSRVDLP